MFKFIHAADVHLDSPLKGLERYDGAPVDEIRNATRRALQGLVDLALDEDVALVLIAGDLYDGDWRDYNTGLFFVSQMTRLREAGVRVFLVSGNHDAANRMTRSLRLPNNVTSFPADAAATEVLDELGVAIHGQSFKTAAVHDDLASAYPAAVSGCFNVGLLHTCAGGYAEHEPYAPCTVDGLRAKQYDYWALGHVHKRDVLCENPLIAFSGNVQGRHVRECGPKGCLLVTVEDDHSVRHEFLALDVLRWEAAAVDVTGSRSGDELLARVVPHLAGLYQQSDGRPLAVRVALVGSAPFHESLAAQRARWTSEIRSHAIDVSGGQIWVEKIQVKTSAPRRRGADEPGAGGPLAELTELFGKLRSEPEAFGSLEADFSDLLRKLPAEITEGPDALRLDDPDWLRSLLDEVEPLLAGRLLQKDGTQ
ncbi:MAG: DNA repair exonuclease [Planctomycetes bacterium]|nr:DNA repair exonuclease [Planctomycetota bacterium]